MALITDFDEIFIDEETGLYGIEFTEKKDGKVINRYKVLEEDKTAIELKIKDVVALNVRMVSSTTVITEEFGGQDE